MYLNVKKFNMLITVNKRPEKCIGKIIEFLKAKLVVKLYFYSISILMLQFLSKKTIRTCKLLCVLVVFDI